MDVEIRLRGEAESPLVFHNVAFAYPHGAFYCVRQQGTGRRVLIPASRIWQVTEWPGGKPTEEGG